MKSTLKQDLLRIAYDFYGDKINTMRQDEEIASCELVLVASKDAIIKKYNLNDDIEFRLWFDKLSIELRYYYKGSLIKPCYISESLDITQTGISDKMDPLEILLKAIDQDTDMPNLRFDLSYKKSNAVAMVDILSYITDRKFEKLNKQINEINNSPTLVYDEQAKSVKEIPSWWTKDPKEYIDPNVNPGCKGFKQKVNE